MKYDVLGIGNAIVDILTHVNDDFLKSQNLDKGMMTLVDEEAAAALYDQIGQAVECSGGSAANTIAGLASLGSKTAYIGKIRDDQLGNVFGHDIRALGVHFDTETASEGPSTAFCQVLVTDDAERTMCTYLGACVNLGPNDVDENLVKNSAITYLEGYLWDPEAAKQAFLKAMDIAHDAGNRIALSLSDPFCVVRHKEEFLDLVKNHVDILFANEEELLTLYDTQDINDALQKVGQDCEIAAVTLGAKGCAVVNGSDIIEINGVPVSNLVDTTGAGDLFAAGFLHGLTQGADLATCGKMGNVVAGHIITHMGPRPDIDLAAYLAENT